MKDPLDQLTQDWLELEPTTAHWYVNSDGEWMCSIHGRITALEGCHQCRALNLCSPKDTGKAVSVFSALKRNGKQESANFRSHVVNASAVETTRPESGLYDAFTRRVGIRNAAEVLVFSHLRMRNETYHPKVLYGRTTTPNLYLNSVIFFGAKESKK